MPRSKSLEHAVASNDQEGSFDAEAFSIGVAENLKLGHFRLVFVLDEAPEELVRLVNYLETISDQLVIDLITLSSYSVNESQILVPQRVKAGRQRLELTPVTSPQPKSEGTIQIVEGAEDFVASIATAPETSRSLLQRLRACIKSLPEPFYGYHVNRLLELTFPLLKEISCKNTRYLCLEGLHKSLHGYHANRLLEPFNTRSEQCLH